MFSTGHKPAHDGQSEALCAAQEDALDFFDVDEKKYPKMYSFLRAQHDALICLSAAIKANMEICSPQESQKYQFIEFLIESMLLADFGTVFASASNTITEIQSMLARENNAFSNFISISSTLLAISLRLSKIFSYFSCTATAPAIQARQDGEVRAFHGAQQAELKSDQLLVLCRICEEYVPIEMIEQHSENCVIAYESEFTMITTDERIRKLQKAMRSSVLNEKWPGTSQKTVSTLLPILHVIMLLDAALQSNNNNETLTNASNSIAKIEIQNATPNTHSLLMKAKELMMEKTKACDAFHEAAQVLQKTRISGHTFGAQSLQTNIADFTFIKRISSGAFAKVFIGVKVRTGDVYAVKVTPKSGLKQKNTLKRALTEKDILLQNNNPFIVDFYYSIIGNHNLYLVMEYLPGGDLFSLLHHIGSLSEKDARTYTAQIIKALEYLHASGIVHRDLKPDNMLINADGKLKLTDFGLSLFGTFERTISDDNKSIVGTPDYLAPEIILSRPHSFTADYWSLGAVIYEFLVGEPPFHCETESKTFAQILSGHIDLEYLDECSPDVVDLIKKLLTVDPSKRLGFNGIHEIMEHPWFKGLDWGHIDDLEPVFIPEQKDKYSVQYFTERYTFQKNDDIEKDILDDIEIAKTQTPHSVSMTDLSSRNSFASKISEEDTSDDTSDDMSMFPAIALQNLSKRASIFAPRHKRSNSADKNLDLEPESPEVELSISRSFAQPYASRRISLPHPPRFDQQF